MVNLFHALIGALTPVKISGRTYLRTTLNRYGVDLRSIPPTCLDELADEMVAMGEKISQFTRGNIHEKVVTQIEADAWMVAEMLKTREQRHVPEMTGPDSRRRFGPILERHGVPIPPI